MSRRNKYKKYSVDQKVKAVQDYKEGKSAIQLGRELDMPAGSIDLIYNWVVLYDQRGPDGFIRKPTNTSYSKEFKLKIVQEYRRGMGSLTDLSMKHGITSFATLHKWVKQYNSDEALRDYKLKGDITMKPTRKTTLDERIEIVKECLNNNLDYRSTADAHNVAYAQLYQWVKKYRIQGEAGLIDRRGHQKSHEELSEIEMLKRENDQLRHQLEMKERETILLKKVKEIEGRRSLPKGNKKRFI